MTGTHMTEDNKFLYYFKKWTVITPEDESVILSAFEPCSIKKRKSLLVPGKTCKYLYFITTGCLRSYYIDSKGIEHIYLQARTFQIQYRGAGRYANVTYFIQTAGAVV